MPLDGSARVVRELTSRGYNAEREAVTLLAGADDPARAIERAVAAAPDDALRITEAHVRRGLSADGGPDPDPSGSTGDDPTGSTEDGGGTPVETKGSGGAGGGSDGESSGGSVGPAGGGDRSGPSTNGETPGGGSTTSDPSGDGVPTGGSGGDRAVGDRDPSARSVEVSGDVTGESTGTGEYGDFVSLFRDRFERLSRKLRSRVTPRRADAIDDLPGGDDAAMVGLVDEVRSTASGHRILDLEDTTGTFPCLVMKDREFFAETETIVEDEVVAVEGSVSDDGGILFVDSLYFPEVPRNHTPSTADRHVQAALVSDVHVGSQEFMGEAWERFADWFHTPEAASVEYLLIAGDMVEGVGVYPDQDEELDIVDVYEQYERFSEHLKSVPGDVEIVMIPGNHDAVRLAEPQPGFREDLRDIMTAHDARIYGNPSTVTLEGVDFLLYHGMSLDELMAEFPDEEASYEHPHRAMYHLLKKRHLAPKFGGKNRLAAEKEDYLVIDDVPDVFHTGHVHKLGYGKYRNVLTVNSGCWQSQTDFQAKVGIDPDPAVAPIVDLDTLDLTIRRFA
ncbi:DNA polymerase II [Halobacteriales archaeon QS_8_69_26]|nr:MAG: DNA polymerase II [Halobacteriales archaeon QS_8_69_26]